MADEIKNVMVVGAGGELGPFILNALGKDLSFTVSVLSRNESSSTFPSHIKVHRIDSSYPEDELLPALKGQDAVVILIPPMEVHNHKSIIDASVKAGVKRIIPGEFGIDFENQKIIDQVPGFKLKQEVTKYLQSKEGTGLSWTAVINGAFFDGALNVKLSGFDINARKATIFDDGDTLVPYTCLSTIGAAVASAFKHPSLTANKAVYICDYNVTQNELLASLEKATGGEKWEISHRTTAESRVIGFEKLGKGDHSGVGDLIRAAIFKPSNNGDYTVDHELATEALELPKPEPLDVVVEKIVKGEKV